MHAWKYLLLVVIFGSITAHADDDLSVLNFCLQGSGPDNAVKIEEEAVVNCSVHGDGKVELKDRSRVVGDVLSLHEIATDKEVNVSGNLYAEDEIKLYDGTVVGSDVSSGDEIDIKKNVSIGGDVQAVQKIEIDEGFVVVGQVNAFTPVPPVSSVADYGVFSVLPGSDDVVVEENAVTQLSPGSYKKLELKESAEISFSAGEYNFEEFVTKKNAVMNFDISSGAIVFYIQKKLTLYEKNRMTVSGGDASDLLYLVKEGDVKLGKDGDYLGTFIAPDGKIEVEERSVVTGALYGDEIEIKKNAVINGKASSVQSMAIFGEQLNTAPTANAVSVSLIENTSIDITLTGFDPEGEVITFSLVDAPEHGQITGELPVLVYTPNEDFVGSDSIRFTVNDGELNSSVATIAIIVNEMSNNVPIAVGQALSVDEDGVLALTLTGSDVDGDALTFSILDGPVHGTLSGSPPELVYVPETGFSGADFIVFEANDGVASSPSATIQIEVIVAPNTPPMATNGSYSVESGRPVSVVLAANDTDGDALSFSVLGGPAHGTLTGSPPELVYISEAGFTGSDFITFEANDGVESSSPATIQIEVAAVPNVPPVAADSSYSVESGQPVSIALEANDPDGDALTFSVLDGPVHGTLSGTPPGFVYVSEAGFSGADQFTFEANDGVESSSPATIQITVIAGTNVPPVADAGDSEQTDFGSSVELNGTGSSDADGDTLTYQWRLVSSPENSQAGFSDSLIATPVFFGDTKGEYILSLVVNDGKADSEPDTTTVLVGGDPLDLVPTASATWTIRLDDFEFGWWIDLDASGSSDPEGQALEYLWTIVNQDPNDTASLEQANSEVASLLREGFNSNSYYEYTFELRVSDGVNISDPVQVAVPTDVEGTNLIGFDDTDELHPLGTILQFTPDAFDESITYDWSFASLPASSQTSFTSPTNKTTDLELDTAGTYVIRLVANYGYPGHEQVFTKTIRAVDPNNQAPIAVAVAPETITVDNISVVVNLDGAGSSDPDQDELSFRWSLDPPTGSTATLSDSNSPTPSFIADVRGDYYIELIVDDGQLEDDLEIEVYAEGSQPNNPPLANGGADQSAVTGQLVVLNAESSIDPDGDPLDFYWTIESQPIGSSADLSSEEEITTEFTPDLAGVYVLSLEVYDWLDFSADTITIEVTEGNIPPVAIARTASSNTPAYPVLGQPFQLDGSQSYDPEGQTLSYNWEIITAPNGSAATVIQSDTAAPMVTTDVLGNYLIKLEVSDGTDTTLDIVRVRAYSPNNKAPIALISGPSTAEVNEEVSLDGSAAFDPDGDLIQRRGWAVIHQPAFSSVTFGLRNTDTFTFIGDKSGTYIIAYAVDDGVLQSETTALTVTLVGDNQAPIANAGTDKIASVGELVALNGSLSDDPDQDSITYTWELLSSPSGSSTALMGSGLINPTLIPDEAGQYVIELIVNDGVVNSPPDTVVLTASSINQPPMAQLTSSGSQVVIGETVTLDGSGSSDPDGDQLQYRWSLVSQPTGSNIQIDTDQFLTDSILSVEPNVVGTYSVSLSVSDGVITSDSVELYLSVTRDPALNTAPIAAAGYDRKILVNTQLILNGDWSYDADSDQLSYQWDLLNKPSASTSELVSANSRNTVLNLDMPGRYVVQLTVNDGLTNSVPDTVDLTVVDEVPDAPPDPGPLLDELMGSDVNTNQVRDDIERFILANYGSEPNTVNSLFQLAQNMYSEFLVTVTDVDSLENHLRSSIEASECVFAVISDRELRIAAIDAVHSEMFNTLERYEITQNIYNASSGYVVVGRAIENWEESCDFIIQ